MTTKPSQMLDQTLRLLSVIVALLAALLIMALVTTALAEENFSAEVVHLVNIERLKAGLPSLEEQPDLLPAASARAQEAAIKFSHTRPDGSKWKTIFNEHHIAAIRVGENLAMGQRSPKSVVRAWMASTSHRNNILNPEFDHIAVGLYEKNGVRYWSQLFTHSSATVSVDASAKPVVTEQKAMVSGTPTLNVRASASTKSQVLTIADEGRRMTVLAVSGKWAYVQTNDGTTGWASTKFLVLGPKAVGAPQLVVDASAVSSAPLLAKAPPPVLTIVAADPDPREATVSGTSSLNVRSRATTKARILTAAAKGSTLYVLETSGDWARVRTLDGTEGWASTKYLSMDPEPTPIQPTKHRPMLASGNTARVAGMPTLNIRSKASTKSQVLAIASEGTKLSVLEVSGKWARVQLADGTEGWVSTKYLAA